MADRYDLKADQGATFYQWFDWTAPDGAGVQQLVDLTGCTARMQVREAYESPSTFLDLTTENDGIELGGVLGTIELNVAAAVTGAWVLPAPTGFPPRQVMVYDLEIVFPDNSVVRLLEGTFTIGREVTR